MKIVIEIQSFTDDPADGEAVIRRRLLSGPRADLQIAGFQCTVAGEVVAEDSPGDQLIMAVEPLEAS